MERWAPTAGTPQGAVISPLLANLYLHPLDELMAAHSYAMVRYADDFVVLCENRAAARALIGVWTASVCILRGRGSATSASRVQASTSSAIGSKPAGARFARRAVTRLKDSLRAKTTRTRGDSLARIVEDLNPVPGGWFGYFKHAHPYTFEAIDGFVRRRLRALLRRQEKRPGFGRCLADRRRSSNAFFAQAGLFARYPAWQTARPPDEETTDWKPYAGKPLVRFGGRGGETLPDPDHAFPLRRRGWPGPAPAKTN